MTLGQKLVDARGKTGLSLASVAKKVGVTKQAVSNWEHDLSRPSDEYKQKLCKLYKVKIDFFF